MQSEIFSYEAPSHEQWQTSKFKLSSDKSAYLGKIKEVAKTKFDSSILPDCPLNRKMKSVTSSGRICIGRMRDIEKQKKKFRKKLRDARNGKLHINMSSIEALEGCHSVDEYLEHNILNALEIFEKKKKRDQEKINQIARRAEIQAGDRTPDDDYTSDEQESEEDELEYNIPDHQPLISEHIQKKTSKIELENDEIKVKNLKNFLKKNRVTVHTVRKDLENSGQVPQVNIVKMVGEVDYNVPNKFELLHINDETEKAVKNMEDRINRIQVLSKRDNDMSDDIK